MHEGIHMTRSKVKVTGLLKFKNCTFLGLSPLPYTMGAGKWLLTLKLKHNMQIWSGRIFDICPSFCITWPWTWRCPCG